MTTIRNKARERLEAGEVAAGCGLRMARTVDIAKAKPKSELLWASPRELLNIFQADDVGCHIITVTNDILKKLGLAGKDQTEYSLETVQMFYRDATAAGYDIETSKAAE